LNASGKSLGGLVESVIPGSPAAAAGIEAGDIITSLDGHILHDVIDYQFFLEPRAQLLEFRRGGQRSRTELNNSGDDPGIFFSSVVFDRVRTCSNECVFCFVDQVPADRRAPLYLKDDDFRLSFLHGNFITLNNLRQADLDRVNSQRLSPLHVSVHAIDPGVRARLMGCRLSAAEQGLANLKQLGQDGIETHIQIVLCPGINDGAVLEATVSGLAQDYAGVVSVGIVPVALGELYLSENPGVGLRQVTVADAATVIDAVDNWQKRFRLERGTGFVYLADEFFLKIGRPLPPPQYYDDFFQYENGIGIAVSFVAAAEEMVGKLADSGPGRIFLLTGTLAARLVLDVALELSHSLNRDIRPLVAENILFGPHVTVAGLLGGRDIIAAASTAGLNRNDLLLIPAAALDSAAERFLDDMTIEELQEALDARIVIASR